MKRAALAPQQSLRSSLLADGIVPAWPGEKIIVAGAETFVRRTPGLSPDTEPALYVHGLGGSSLNWTDMAYLLADRLDAEAIDLPGFGYSGPGRSYTIATMADRVITWIEHSGRGPVHLFGNSLGGAISVRVAGTRPDLVRTLTLISPAMPFLDPRKSLQSRLVPFLVVPNVSRLAARRLASVSPEELAAQALEACWAQPDRVHPQRLIEAIDEVRRRSDAPWYMDAYMRSLRGLVGSFLRSYFPGANSQWRVAARITAPTLVITGRQDRLVDVRVAPAVAKLIPDSRLMILDQVGHVAQMERPEIVARGVLAMLDEVRGTLPVEVRGAVPAEARGAVPVEARAVPADVALVPLAAETGGAGTSPAA